MNFKRLTLSLLLFLPHFAFTQNTNVPPALLEKFNSLYPKAADIRWSGNPANRVTFFTDSDSYFKVIAVDREFGFKTIRSVYNPIPIRALKSFRSLTGLRYPPSWYGPYTDPRYAKQKQVYWLTYRYNCMSDLLPKGYQLPANAWVKKGIEQLKYFYDNTPEIEINADSSGYKLTKRTPYIHSPADTNALCTIVYDSTGNVMETYVRIKDSLASYIFYTDSSHSQMSGSFSVGDPLMLPSKRGEDRFQLREGYLVDFDSAGTTFSSKNKNKTGTIFIYNPTRIPPKIWVRLKQYYHNRCRFEVGYISVDKTGITSIETKIGRGGRAAVAKFNNKGELIGIPSVFERERRGGF